MKPVILRKPVVNWNMCETTVSLCISEGGMRKSIGGNLISQPEPSATNARDQVTSPH